MKSQQISSNGSGASVSADAQLDRGVRQHIPEVPERKKILSRGQEEMLGAILKMQRDLFEHGKQRSLERGALEPHAEDIESLEDHV